MAEIIAKDYRLDISNKRILSIVLPISLAIIVPQLNFITNNIFLGRLGEQTLSVAGITGVYYLIFAVIGIGLSNGLQMLFARRAGENKIEAIGFLFDHGKKLAFVFAAFGIAITWLIAPIFFNYALSDATNAQLAIDFLHIRIWGLFFLFQFQIRNALLVGTNHAKYLIFGTAIEATSNVFFDYTLIFGNLGFPDLGFNGAAYASILAEALAFITVWQIIRFKKIKQQLQFQAKQLWDKAVAKIIFKQSAPLIAQHLLSIMAWEFFFVLSEHHGNQAGAISNIMRNVFGVFGCVTWAFAATTNTMVSNVIGQGLQDKVFILINKILKLSFTFSISICILINIFPELYLSVYGQTEAFNTAAIPVLRVVTLALLLMSFSVVWLNAVIGTGNTNITLRIEFLAITLYCTYVYIVLEKLNLSITIGWMAELVYWGSLLIPAFIYMKSNKWKNRKI